MSYISSSLSNGLARFFACAFFSFAALACSAETTNVAETTIDETPIAPSKPKVVMETTLGKVTLELFIEKAPLSVANFLTYVDSGHYNDTIFHRVIPGFMAQGGGYDTKMKKKTTLAPIKNESDNGVKNLRTTISMARTNNPDSATAQFFINYSNNASLNGPVGYAVFGRVIEGMSVVDAMATQPQGALGRQGGGAFVNAPNTPIVITKAYRLKTEER